MNQYRTGFWASIPPVTKNLIIINALCWLATVVFLRLGFDLTSYLGLHYFVASDFNPAQLITYMFLHDSRTLTHLFFNMFSLYMFGRTLEYVWGSKRFLMYYMITGIGAGIVQEATWFFQMHSELQQLPEAFTMNGMEMTKDALLNHFITVGASGAIFGILLAYGMMFPDTPLYIMFIPIPIKAKYFVIFYGVVELFFGVGNFSGDNIAHFAHLGGMLFGYFLIKYWRMKGFNNGRYF